MINNIVLVNIVPKFKQETCYEERNINTNIRHL